MSRILLIGCGKEKAISPQAAEDLYTGGLFRARRAYAEATGLPWRVLSARYGVVRPDVVLHPYNLTIGDLNWIDRGAWGLGVVAAILDEIDNAARPREVVLEVHAGEDYVEAFREIALQVGLCVDTPVKGLSIGAQRKWYSETLKGARAGLVRS